MDCCRKSRSLFAINGKPQVFGPQYASKSFFYFTQHPLNPDLNNPDAKDTTISQEPL